MPKPCPRISYIFCTRNRLALLRYSLQKLRKTLQENEEIVVVDGCSNDGTQLFLAGLGESLSNFTFISEPDRNQAHGWNKAMLLARGTYIKKIIDDDIYDYGAIRACADWLDANNDCDLVTSNDLSVRLGDISSAVAHSNFQKYQLWSNGIMPSFPFGDMHMLLRRSSLSILGLYNTSFVNMDYEYSLRISYARANIAFYSGCIGLSVNSPDTISSRISEATLRHEGKRANAMYFYRGRQSEISPASKIKILIGKALKHAFICGSDTTLSGPISASGKLDTISFYNDASNYLAEYNKSCKPRVYCLGVHVRNQGFPRLKASHLRIKKQL